MARLIALVALSLSGSAACGGDHEIVFPPDDAASDDGGGGKRDAGPERDAGRDAARDATPGDDAGDAGRDAGDAGPDGATDSGIDSGIDSGVNRAPVATNLSVEVDEDGAQSEQLLASDADGDPLSFELVDGPDHGTLVLDEDSGEITYTPAANYHGADSFAFRVSDGDAVSPTATVAIAVLSVNDAPVATGATLDAEEDTALTLTLMASDVDGDTLSYEIIDDPEHGLLSGALAARNYTPDQNFNGSDGFSFRVSDGVATSATVTVAIDVAARNDAPAAVGEGIDVDEGATATSLAGGATSLLANDSDLENDALSVAAAPATGPAHGQLTLNADGTFSYAHDGSESTSDSFIYTVCDAGTPSACATATVTVAIRPIDDAPNAVADTLTVVEGGSATLLTGGNDSVIDNDADAEGEDLTVSLETDAVHGTLVLNADGTFSYAHDGSESATDSFVYEVCDEAPVLCATATVTITVTPVNESPVATDDAITVAEGATATALTGGDDSVTDNDTDPDADPLTATVVDDVDHGTLTLAANGTFSYVHDGSETTSDSFTYQACDDDATPLCDLATVTITVTLVNDAPVAVDDTITVAEGATATTLSGGGSDLRANDTDAEGDALSVTLTPEVGAGRGTLTLQADGTFSYVHDGSEGASDSFDYQVCDAGGCDIGRVTITITPVNDAPVAVTDDIQVSEGGTATSLVGGGMDLRANDLDAESDALTVTTTPIAAPIHGTLTLNADGTFSYVHDGSETTSDSFEYEICDPSGDCDSVVVAIAIAPVNEPPVAADDAITVAEGGTEVLLSTPAGADSVIDNDSDPDGNGLSVAVESGPTNGTLTLNPDGTFSYTHNGSETTSDSFEYELCDDALLTPLCAIATVSITVTPVNDPPLVGADAFTVAEAGMITVVTSVVANDSDPENGVLSATLSSGPANDASFTFNADGSFSYAHDGSEGASDSFVYSVCDDAAVPACSTGTVTITVTAVNDGPTAVADAITVAEGGTATLLSTPAGADSVSDNDTDAENDALTVSLSGAVVANGTLTLQANGTFSYTHNGGETTSDSFGYQVCDPSNACSSATVTIAITAVNDPPVAADHAIALGEGGTATALVGGGTDLRANASDAENDALTVDVVPVVAPVNGTVTLNANGTFSYTHNGSETTSDGFDFSVCDGSGCDTGHVAIAVAPVNDPPVAVTEAIAVAEGGTATTLVGGGTDLRANDTDAENGALTVNTIPVVPPLRASSFTLNADGTFSYTHNGSETTSDSFVYEVCDPSGACGSVAVTITIAEVNEAPVAAGDSFSVLEGGTATVLGSGDDSVIDNDSDPDNDALSATVQTPPARASSFTLNANGTFSYTHNGSETTSDSFVYQLCDDDVLQLCTTATVSITVTPGNDAPVAVGDAFTVAEAGTASVLAGGATSVLANDTDPDSSALTVTVATPPANDASFTLNPNGTFSYVHDGSEGPSDSFTYNVCDDAAVPACSIGTVTITVTQTNDGPVAGDDAITVAEGGTATLLTTLLDNVTANDPDPENDTLTVALSGANVANGTLTLNPNGTFSYTHNGGETTSDGFDYEVCDPSSACDIAHVTIAISSVNDAPVINGDAIAVAEGGTATTLTSGASNVLANDTDAEGALTMSSLITPPTFAINFALNPDGTFSYTHNGSETTSDSFVYRACDSGGLCANATVTIAVSPVNDAPAGVADSATVAEGGTVMALIAPPRSSVLDNDTDAESNALTASLLLGPSNGVLTLNGDGSFAYTHNGGETTSDSFSYVACEQLNPLICSASTTVTIAVTPVDDPPVAVDDAIAVNEGATATTLSPSGTSVSANDTDVESNALTVTTTAVVAPAHASSFTLNANGTFSYTHDGGETTSDSFTYRVCETAAPALCDEGLVVITITPVNDAPVGGSYSYGNVVGNTLYTVTTGGPSDSALLLGANDSDLEAGSVLSVSSIDVASAQGGTVTNLGGGRFSYLPPAGHLGADTFHYRISDNGAPTGTTDVTVNLTVGAPLIWYVDDDYVGTSTGRSSQPFTTLAAADAGITPIADTRIYVHPGTYAGALSLAAGQTLHGAGDAFTPSATVAFPAGSRPALTATASAAVTLTGNNVVRGINVTSTFASGNAINGVGVTGTVAISNVTLSAVNGNAIGLAGSAALALSGLGAITGRGGIVTTGISITTSGAPISIAAIGGPALDITGGTLNASFSTLSSTTSATDGIRLSGVNGMGPTLTSGATTVTNPSRDGISISGATGAPIFSLGACTVTQAGTAAITTGDGYAFSSNAAATSISLSIAVDPATQNGRGLFASSTGSIAIASVPATFSAIGGAAIDLRNTAGNVAASGHWRFNALSSTNSAAEGVKLQTLSTPVEVQGATTLTNPLLEGIRSDDTTGDLTFAAVTVNTRRNAGVFVNNADNSLVTFGALTIPNPNTRAENALQIQNSNAAVSVTSATIANAATAIRLLANTGGSFTLSPTGVARGAGGTISQATSSAILIDNCEDVSLDDLIITNVASLGEHGIDANTIDGFVLRNSEINRLGNADNEFGVTLSQATGALLIDDVLITNMADHGIDIVNTSGTANLRILNAEVSHNDAGTHCTGGVPCGGYGISVNAGGTAVMNLLVDNGLFEFLDVEGIQVLVGGTANVNATIRNSDFLNGTLGDSAIELNQTSGTLRYDIASNIINMWSGNLVSASANMTSGSATVDGTIRNNTITANPVFGNVGILVLADLASPASYTGRVEITGNTVTNTSGRGISSVIRGTATGVTLNTRVLGNTVVNALAQGVFVQAQNATRQCARVGDATGGSLTAQRNTASSTLSNYQLNRAAASSFDFEGTAPATADGALQTGNVQPNTRTISLTVPTVVAPNTCTAPTLPTVPL